ncbi:MAG: 6-phosphogluconolactonase, partial [Muribaculaceae bacterium]|nr:6-phosphogluconolactonase [Muribaculaceae bacterium]
MRTDLSSQIKLDRIPRRYYNPDSEIELAALRREEKLDTRIFETATDGADFIAGEIVRYIKRYTEQKGKCVLALGAGNSTHRVYAALINLYKEGKVDFSKVIIFNISEFFPLNPGGPSTLTRLNEVFLKHVDIKPENIRTINPAITKDTMYEY